MDGLLPWPKRSGCISPGIGNVAIGMRWEVDGMSKRFRVSTGRVAPGWERHRRRRHDAVSACRTAAAPTTDAR